LFPTPSTFSRQPFTCFGPPIVLTPPPPPPTAHLSPTSPLSYSSLSYPDCPILPHPIPLILRLIPVPMSYSPLSYPLRLVSLVQSPFLFYLVQSRETREGWPLLTVETDVNGDSKSTNEKRSILGWFVGLVVPVREIFVLPWLL
jgi:hypothetical protein